MWIELPTKPATTDQMNELHALTAAYMRDVLILQHPKAPPELLGAVLNLKDGPARRLKEGCLEKARKYRADAAVMFAAEVIHGMLSGRLAGVVGTRRTNIAKFAFARIHSLTQKQVDECKVDWGFGDAWYSFNVAYSGWKSGEGYDY